MILKNKLNKSGILAINFNNLITQLRTIQFNKLNTKHTNLNEPYMTQDQKKSNLDYVYYNLFLKK